ncbi:MAG TPA: c-type cytochrome [Vicinamibacterales bacterium]|nr:c-type cytochrome [Vicinamibacterales bacterium]
MRSSHLVAGALLLFAGAALARPGRSETRQTQAQGQNQGISGNVEHGRYLVNEVAMCPQCHSPRDDQGNLIASKLFEGGPVAVRPPWPNDWALIAPRNKGLPGYDDAAAMRLLTEGAIGRDGKQLRAPMPRFRMTKQDASDVIAYMRSLR